MTAASTVSRCAWRRSRFKQTTIGLAQSAPGAEHRRAGQCAAGRRKGPSVRRMARNLRATPDSRDRSGNSAIWPTSGDSRGEGPLPTPCTCRHWCFTGRGLQSRGQPTLSRSTNYIYCPRDSPVGPRHKSRPEPQTGWSRTQTGPQTACCRTRGPSPPAGRALRGPLGPWWGTDDFWGSREPGPGVHAPPAWPHRLDPEG